MQTNRKILKLKEKFKMKQFQSLKSKHNGWENIDTSHSDTKCKTSLLSVISYSLCY